MRNPKFRSSLSKLVAENFGHLKKSEA
jgi:hypothetical protein